MRLSRFPMKILLFAAALFVLLVTRAHAERLTSRPPSLWEPSTFFFVEEFPVSSGTSGSIGTLGWTSNAIAASTPVFTRTASSGVHLGIINYATAVAATAGQGGALALGASAVSSVLTGLGNTAGWQSTFIFKLTQTTATRLYLGFLGDFTTGPPTSYIGLRYDVTSGIADTNFTFVCSTSSTATTSVSVAADTNWHKLTIRSGTAGTVLFSLDGAAEVAIASNCPTGNISPAFQLLTDATAQKFMDIDYFSFYWPNLAR